MNSEVVQRKKKSTHVLKFTFKFLLFKLCAHLLYIWICHLWCDKCKTTDGGKRMDRGDERKRNDRHSSGGLLQRNGKALALFK